jgi:hypothetical protein
MALMGALTCDQQASSPRHLVAACAIPDFLADGTVIDREEAARAYDARWQAAV